MGWYNSLDDTTQDWITFCGVVLVLAVIALSGLAVVQWVNFDHAHDHTHPAHTHSHEHDPHKHPHPWPEHGHPHKHNIEGKTR